MSSVGGAPPVLAQETPRGFTGHEHLDRLALIHMNGRVYDPALGRFISADPIVQFPASTQGMNRYAYVANNPLSFTDPSGFGIFGSIGGFFKSIGRAVTRGFQKVTANPIGRVAVLIGASVACAPAGLSAACAAGASAAITAAHGGGPGDIAKSAAITFATAEAFALIGGTFGDVTFANYDFGTHAVKIVAHGVVGGVSNELSGGSFVAGFAAGALTQAVAPAISSLRLDTVSGRIGRTAIAAVAGGVGAKLGGGKFLNGAVTGAFSRMFNDEAIHRRIIMKAGEAIRGSAVRDVIRSNASTIDSEAKSLNVDADLIRGIIFEEQTHLLPFEGFAERFGIGRTVGLGQVTVGSFGYTRDQLLDSATNIHAMARILSDIQQLRVIDNNSPFASIATRYNCSSCSAITNYGERVSNFRLGFVTK